MRRPALVGPFTLLLVALSLPLWLAGAGSAWRVLPGVPATTVLLVFCPLVAASTLVYRDCGARGVTALLARACDIRSIPSRIWLVPCVLLMPGVMVLSYVAIRVMHTPISRPAFSIWLALELFAVFCVAAVGEEIGWSGYAIDRLQSRWPAFHASVILGLLWGGWHVVPLLEVGRSATWIAWWLLFTVAGRVLMVWIYNNTGNSVFATILYHDMSNLSVYLPPNDGASFDPRVTGAIVAVIAAAVTIAWGPRTLARAPSFETLRSKKGP